MNENNELESDSSSNESLESENIENTLLLEDENKSNLQQINIEKSNITTEVDNDFNDVVTTSKSKKLLIITVIIIIVLLVGFGIFYMNSKRTMTKSIVLVKSNLKELFSFKLNNNNTYQKILNADTFTTKNDIKISSILGEYNFKIDSVTDNKNNNMQAIMSLLSDNKEIISLDMIMNDNKLYMKLKKFMEIYYYFDNLQMKVNELYEFQDIDFDYLIDIVTNNISDSIIKTDIKSKYVSTKINDEDKKVRKLTFEYNEDALSKLIVEICNDLKEDKALNELTKLTSLEKEAIKTNLDNLINDIKSSDIDNNKIIFSYIVYCDLFNNIIGYELSNDYFIISSLEDKNINEINIISNKEKKEVLNIIIEEKEEEYSIDLIYKENSEKLFRLNGIITKDDSFDFNLETMGQTIKIIGNNQIKEENGIVQINTITLSMLGQNLLDLTITSNITEGGNINLDDIKNAKNINEMNEDEQNRIIYNIMNDEVINEFITSLQNIFGSDTSILNE